MELVLEKNLDFLLRPRDDMWWLRKERLLVVKMQDSTAREREREGGGNRWLNQRQNRHQDTQMRGEKKQKTPNRKRARDKRKKKHNQR